MWVYCVMVGGGKWYLRCFRIFWVFFFLIWVWDVRWVVWVGWSVNAYILRGFQIFYLGGYFVMDMWWWLIFRGDNEGIFWMFCCRQVLVLVSPRWLWERCWCLLVAICTRIRRCWMRSFYIWKKDYGCGFFVLWCPPLHRCSVWWSCLFLLWLYIWCLYIGIYLVGGMCFWPYNCIGCKVVMYCWLMRFFCCVFLLFVPCCLCNCSWSWCCLYWRFWLGGYYWGSV